MDEAKPTFGQDLSWRLETGAYDVLTFVLRLLPVDWVSAFGGWMLRTLGPLTGQHRVARINLKIAFPDADDAWIEDTLKAQWDNVGRAFAEFPVMDKLRPSTGRVELVNGERLDEIAAQHQAVVFVSGHLSNWEIMPAAIVDRGVDCLMTYRAANNPYFDKRIRQGRARYGVTLFAQKGGADTRKLYRALSAGTSVALMMDQRFEEGLAMPFFGEMAHTNPGAVRLALQFDTVLQTMSVQRLKGARFRAVVHDPIVLERTGDREADMAAGVARINAFMEERIRERPAEWFWVHHRWPREIYRKDRQS
ncbi:MAG: lysophospholipid acyltransferase family protein [Caulobacteraceae bacterium]